MRGWMLFIVLAACVMFSGTAMARQPDGFSGTAFGTPLSALPSFMTLKKTGTITYAINLNERYRLDGRAPVVVYGFASGKLFAAYVCLDGMSDREAMVRRLTTEFGKPTVAKDDGAEVLRWRKGKVKVKLKSNAATGALKVGYYSTAATGLSAKLLDLDSVDLDGLVKQYEKDKISKGITPPPVPAPKRTTPFGGGSDNALPRVQ